MSWFTREATENFFIRKTSVSSCAISQQISVTSVVNGKHDR